MRNTMTCAALALAGERPIRLTQPLNGPVPEPGSRVVVGVRPEHFGDAGKGDADLAVKVDIVEHLGGTSFVYASTRRAASLSSSATRTSSRMRPK